MAGHVLWEASSNDARLLCKTHVFLLVHHRPRQITEHKARKSELSPGHHCQLGPGEWLTPLHRKRGGRAVSASWMDDPGRTFSPSRHTGMQVVRVQFCPR